MGSPKSIHELYEVTALTVSLSGGRPDDFRGWVCKIKLWDKNRTQESRTSFYQLAVEDCLPLSAPLISSVAIFDHHNQNVHVTAKANPRSS